MPRGDRDWTHHLTALWDASFSARLTGSRDHLDGGRACHRWPSLGTLGCFVSSAAESRSDRIRNRANKPRPLGDGQGVSVSGSLRTGLPLVGSGGCGLLLRSGGFLFRGRRFAPGGAGSFRSATRDGGGSGHFGQSGTRGHVIVWGWWFHRPLEAIQQPGPTRLSVSDS